MLELRVLSSLDTVRPGSCPKRQIKILSCAKNEQCSFQLAFRLKKGEPHTLPVILRIESELPIKFYYANYVAMLHTYSTGLEPLTKPGLIPDMLLEKAVNPPLKEVRAPWGGFRGEVGEKVTLNASGDSWQTCLFCINEERRSVKPGTYTIKLRMEAAAAEITSAESELQIKVEPFALPKQKLLYTCWLHCDCLADYYNEEPYTDRFFEILRDYVHKAAINGMNMVLLPAFTPPLDTPIGQYRRNVQLVKVIYAEGAFSFDFSLMKKFIEVCLDAGAEYFEHSHFFMQWGAEFAPMIIANVDGTEKRIFGWDVKADDPLYVQFLNTYIPAVRAFLRDMGLEKRVLFHISDEPTEKNLPTYSKAAAIVQGLLKGCMSGDALSDYSLYEKGLVKTPIVATNYVADFKGRCPHFWAYYTGGQVQGGLSNRLLSVEPGRNRIIGVQLYSCGAEGFLHWAYNYWYDRLSQGLFDPKVNPCGYNNNPGTTYQVYPANDGTAIQTIRQKVFAEAINDFRALKLLEKHAGRIACEELITRFFGEVDMYTVPESADSVLAFRSELNTLIAGYYKKHNEELL